MFLRIEAARAAPGTRPRPSCAGLRVTVRTMRAIRCDRQRQVVIDAAVRIPCSWASASRAQRTVMIAARVSQRNRGTFQMLLAVVRRRLGGEVCGRRRARAGSRAVRRCTGRSAAVAAAAGRWQSAWIARSLASRCWVHRQFSIGQSRRARVRPAAPSPAAPATGVAGLRLGQRLGELEVLAGTLRLLRRVAPSAPAALRRPRRGPKASAPRRPRRLAAPRVLWRGATTCFWISLGARRTSLRPRRARP